jgi:hypothetical protein
MYLYVAQYYVYIYEEPEYNYMNNWGVVIWREEGVQGGEIPRQVGRMTGASVRPSVCPLVVANNLKKIHNVKNITIHYDVPVALCDKWSGADDLRIKDGLGTGQTGQRVDGEVYCAPHSKYIEIHHNTSAWWWKMT